jgi:hypothetical protein
MVFGYAAGRRIVAFVIASFFLVIQASLLLTSPHRSYPDISAPGLNSYVLVVEMANDGVSATADQNRLRNRDDVGFIPPTLFATVPLQYIHSDIVCDVELFHATPYDTTQFSMTSRK